MLQLSNNINQTEAVQRRSARSVMNDWSTPDSQSGRSSSSKGSPTLMMQQLGWNTLEVRRNQARAGNSVQNSQRTSYRFARGVKKHRIARIALLVDTNGE